MTQPIALGKALGARYEISEQRGTVTGSDTRSETEVSGTINGGGGSSYNGTGYSAPVHGSIESKTTRFQNVFIEDADGHEHLIETVDFLVPCKAGQQVSYFSISIGSGGGPYIAAHNHSTRQQYQNPKALRSAMFPGLVTAGVISVCSLWAWIGVASSQENGFWNGFFAALITALISGAVMGAVGSVVGFIRARSVRRNPDFTRYLTSLTTP